MNGHILVWATLYSNMPPVHIQALVYANNIAIMANKKGELQRAVTEWASACRETGMEINISKSKTMHITKGIQRRLNNEWEGDRMEQVEETDYLRTIISANGKNETEINNRVQNANQVYYH
jgi:hypothetical protein